MNFAKKHMKLSRYRPRNLNSVDFLLNQNDGHEENCEDSIDENQFVDNDNDDYAIEADKSIKNDYRNYLHTQRQKFDEHCEEQREYQNELRKICLENQEKLRIKFRIDPPVNRFSDISAGDSKWLQCSSKLLNNKRASTTIVDYTEELWNYFNRFYFDAEKFDLCEIFKGVCIYVNGYTNPVASHLHKLMLLTGGRYTLIYDRLRTTHTIATIISQAQQKSERARNTTVRPEWIIESLRARKLLPLNKFLVFNKSNQEDIRETFAKMNKQQQENKGKNENIRTHRLTTSPINDNFDDIMTIEFDNNQLDNHKHSTPIVEKKSKSILDNQNNQVSNMSDYLPNSMSKFDSMILKELPDDIREEMIDHVLLKATNDKQASSKNIIDINKKNSKSTENSNAMYNNVKQAKDIFFGKINGMKANICGHYDLNMIIELIDEWFLCSIDDMKLNDLDISYFLRFLLQLIDEKRFDDLRQIIIHLKQILMQNNHQTNLSIYNEWKFLFNNTLFDLFIKDDQLSSSIPKDLLPRSLFLI